MRTPASLAAGLVVLFLLAAGLERPTAQQAQQPPAQPPQQEPERAQQPPIRTGISYVSVDVIVTDRNGQPVLDLKPEEFSITEDGKAQKIEAFSVVKIDPASQAEAPPPTEIRSMYDEEREAARPDVRLFLLLLDDYHVRRGNDMVVRKPLIDFVQNQLAPADMVAIMYPLTPVNDLQFTRNRASLISAIENFEGRRFNYEPRNQFEERYAFYPAATVERIRNDVTLSALKGAAIKLSGLREGRKSIIFVSEGFTATLPAQLNDPVAALPGLGNRARRQPGADLTNDSVEFFNTSSMMSDLQEVFRVANRHNTSIYAVDPRGLAPFEYDINQGVGQQADRRHLESSLDTLRALAENTDGRAIVNRNDLAAGMKQIIRDSSGYYLLGYNSTEAPTDGRFHEIKVRVTRRGVDVRARKGYWAFTAEDAERATAPAKPGPSEAVTDALSTLVEPPRGRAARFWVGTTRGAGGHALVTFVWEPVAARPGERRSPDDSAARVMLHVTSPEGRPLFRGRIPDELPAGASAEGATSASAPALPAGASATFDTAPGPIQLRISVEGPQGQVLDSAVREMTVPDYTAVEVAFGSARVYRARTARELQTIKAGGDAVPVVERAFSRTERLFVRAPTYAPGDEKATVTARVLNRAGDAMSDLPVQMTSSSVAELDLALASFAPGDYIIELTAKAATGTAQQLVAFRVGR